MTIKEALMHLDPTDDAQWTSDGLPLVDVVRGLTGNQELTRKEITDVDPEFCRDKAVVKEQAPAKPKTRDEALQEEQAVLDQEIATIIEQRNGLEAILVEKQRRWAVIQAHFERRKTGASDTQSRLDYIRSQLKLRMERAQRSQQVLKGLDLNVVNAKAPIDQAMARKNTRGTQRPVMTPETKKEE